MTNQELAKIFGDCHNGNIKTCDGCPFEESEPSCVRNMHKKVIEALNGSDNDLVLKHRERIYELEESNKGFIAEIEEQDRKITYFRAIIKSIDALVDSAFGE